MKTLYARTLSIFMLMLMIQGIFTRDVDAKVYTSQDFQNSQHEARYWQLAQELRCLVCQNQSLADSNAELAGDLRRVLFEQIQSGKTNQQIRNYLVSRYGNFVLYQPPLHMATIILWISPFFLFIVAAGIFLLWIKHNNTRTSHE